MLNNFKIIDLTHTLDEHIPTWPGSMRFSRELCLDYDRGCRVFNFHLAQGIGTHMDAPAHFIKDGRSISALQLTELIAPVCVIDVTKQSKANSDYKITALDLENWEQQHNMLPKGAILLAHTGWSEYWPDEKQYRNTDAQGVMHFPGFGKDAAEIIVARGLVGVGIDTLSIDPGADPHFEAHHIILGNGLFQLENLTNLAQLLPTGTLLFALPMKILDAPEAPVRVVALVPKT